MLKEIDGVKTNTHYILEDILFCMIIDFLSISLLFTCTLQMLRSHFSNFTIYFTRMSTSYIINSNRLLRILPWNLKARVWVWRGGFSFFPSLRGVIVILFIRRISWIEFVIRPIRWLNIPRGYACS